MRKSPKQLIHEAKELQRECLGADSCPDVVAIENILQEVSTGFDDLRKRHQILEEVYEAQTQLLIRNTFNLDGHTEADKMSIDKLRDDIKLDTDNLHKRINDGGKWVFGILVTVAIALGSYANRIEAQGDTSKVEIKTLKGSVKGNTSEIRAVRMDIVTIRESIIRQEAMNSRILDGIADLKEGRR